MSILIDTEVLPEGWRWDPRNPVRGTEEFYVRTAQELAKLGAEVEVFYDGPYAFHNGVEYFDRNDLQHPPAVDYDDILACNQDPAAAEGKYPADTRLVWWTNKYGQRIGDTAFAGVDAYVVLSEYHRTTFCEPGNPFVHIVGHGCDPIARPAAKAPIAAFTSSPDRGQAYLEKVWVDVEKATGVKLVCSGGKMSNAEVEALYSAARFWVHLGLGVELFCISALKAQSAGCIPIVVPHMALGETVKFGTKTDVWHFAEAAIETIRNPPPVPDFVAPSWAEVTLKIAHLLGVAK